MPCASFKDRLWLPCLPFKQTLFGFHITYYSKSVAHCKGGFQTFLFGHGDGTRTRISRIKSPLQNLFCYTVMLKSSRKSVCFRPGLLAPPGRLAMLYAQSLLLYPRLVVSCGKRPIGPKFNCQRSMSLSLDLGSQLDLACASSFSRSAFSRLNAAYYITFVGRL